MRTACFLAMCAVMGCDVATEPDSSDIPVRLEIQVSRTLITEIEGTVDLHAILHGSSGSAAPAIGVVWETSDSSILTVDGSVGIAHAPGSVHLHARVGELFASEELTVQQRARTLDIAGSPHVYLRDLGAQHQLQFTARDANGFEIPNAEITWASSNPSVAEIDADAVLNTMRRGFSDVEGTVDDAKAKLSISVDTWFLAAHSGFSGVEEQFILLGRTDGSQLDTLDLPWAKSPQWFPDGDSFLATGDGTAGVYDLEGNLRHVFPGDAYSALLSPQGTHVAMIGQRAQRGQLHIIDVATDQSRVIMAEERGIQPQFSWSPDGNQLAVALVSDSDSETYVVSIDDGNKHRVLRVPDLPTQTNPAWSHSGEYLSLVFVSGDLEGSGVYVGPVNGSEEPRKLLPWGRSSSDSAPWSPTALRFAAVSGDQVWVHDLETNVQSPLTERVTDLWYIEPSWSVDGDRILVTRVDYDRATGAWTSNLILLHPDDQDLQQVIYPSAVTLRRATLRP